MSPHVEGTQQHSFYHALYTVHLLDANGKAYPSISEVGVPLTFTFGRLVASLPPSRPSTPASVAKDEERKICMHGARCTWART